MFSGVWSNEEERAGAGGKYKCLGGHGWSATGDVMGNKRGHEGKENRGMKTRREREKERERGRLILTNFSNQVIQEMSSRIFNVPRICPFGPSSTCPPTLANQLGGKTNQQKLRKTKI